MKRMTIFAALCPALFLSVSTAWAAQVPVVAWTCDRQGSAGLAGASFSLSTAPDRPDSNILTTDETGRLVFRDVAEGTYYLHQTAAPGLYAPLRRPVMIQLSAEGALTVEGRSSSEVSILHQSGKAAAIAAVVILSLIPMAVRLIWLHRRGK